MNGVIILGGEANAISLARSFGRHNIPVYFRYSKNSLVKHSKFVTTIDIPYSDNTREGFEQFLLSKASAAFYGSTLLACSDSGIEFLIKNRNELKKNYVVDIMMPKAQKILLNKKLTYRSATQIGVPTPQYWEFKTRNEALNLIPKLTYPVLIKPEYTHLFYEKFGRKYLVAQNANELETHLHFFDKCNEKGILLEYIPGPDSLLCSYYTYIDNSGNPLFDFTKRIIRRYPNNMGNGCYHITDNVKDVKNLSLILFKSIGLLGVANAEFKKDPRTGELKLIECNARFTAANCLLYDSGIDLPLFVYNLLNGIAIESPNSYKIGKRLWYPVDDIFSFFELHKINKITFKGWIKSIFHLQTFPYFKWNDPLPSAVNLFNIFIIRFKKIPKFIKLLLSFFKIIKIS
ncbi:MAG: hypothetical protein HKO91_09070 [Desulfobacterales bacterium]|nr:hypothetical protein [Desulfobacterales bacterium]